MNLVKRFDLRQLGKAIKTDSGFLKCPVSATRVGVLKYYKPDGSVFKELRLPEEVFDKESMSTLGGVPLTNRHPTTLVNKDNAKKFMVGFTSDQVEQVDNKYLNTSVTVTDSKVIEEIEKGGLREVSCGYTCNLDMVPGIYEGEHYDAIQRNIRYNHLAVVDRGRAGPQVRLHMDAADGLNNETDLKIDYVSDAINSLSEGGIMAKMKLGAAEYEVDAGVAQAFDSALKDAEKKGYDAAVNDEMKKKADKEKEVKKSMDALEAKVDELTASNKKLESEKMDSKQIHELVVKRSGLIEKSKAIVKADVKLDDMADLDVKKAVIAAKYPELKLDEKSPEYIDARFDAIIDSEPVKKSTDALKTAAAKLDSARNDGDPESADEVRARNMKNDSEAWKKPLGKNTAADEE